jgi:hypothetical protein
MAAGWSGAMNLPSIVSNKQFKIAALVTGVLSAIYILINIFVIGGDAFVIGLNNNLTVPLAIITLVFSVMLWQKVQGGSNSRFLWGNMIAGWVCWAIAEILWAVFSWTGQEVPYPSLADFFWLVGYIPMGIGLFARVRSLPVKPTSGQQAIIWGISLGTVVFTIIFVLRPIIQNNDPQRLLESILNLIYPLFDLFLLIIVLYLFFSYEQGAYGFGWRLLLIGFIIHQIANLIFSYASSSSLYYPSLQANWTSTLAVDVPYNLSYVFWLVGVYMLRILLSEHRTFELNIQPKLVSNAHLLVFTKSDGTIIDVSHNFYSFFAPDDVKGKTLEHVLELTEQEVHSISEKIRVGKKLNDKLVHIKNHSGISQDGWVCGVAIFTPQGEYSGANYLIRMHVEDNTLDNKLTESEKSVVRHFLTNNISNENNEIRQLLLDYYLAYIKSLFNMAFHEGGATMSQLLLDELQSTAQNYGWQIQLNPQTILDGNLYPVDVLRNALPVFLETAKRFVSRITEPGLVDAELQELQAQIGETIHKNVAQYGKPY